MPITLITGPANAGKAELVMAAVRRHLAHGRQPLLVVPTRADAEHYLRELAGDGAAIGVRVERFAGLLRELMARAGVGEAALGAVARERVIEAVVLREHAPASAGFVRALAELFAELRVRRVTPARWSAALSSLERAGAPAAHGEQLARLFAAYCGELERMRRVDAEQRAVRALDALRERPSLWRETPTLLYGFDDLTALQLDVIETLGRVVDAPVTVSLAYEQGRVAFAARAASFHALAPHAAEHLALAARSEHYAPQARRPLAHLERHLFEPGADAADPAGAVRLLEGGGERAELELVAGEIRSLLAAGMPAQDLAVVVRTGAGATDLELLEEVLTAAGVPFALERRRPFAASALGAALIGLLRCVPGAAAPTRAAGGQHGDGHAGHGDGHAGHGGEHADEPAGVGELLAWLRAPGVLRAVEDGGVTLADRLERAARRAGALTATDARALFEQRNWPLEAIDRLAVAQARGPAALCERADRELHRLFCAPRRGAAELLSTMEREDAAALACGRRALAELRELARAAGELAPASAAELADVLARLELVDERSAGAATLGPDAKAEPDAAVPAPPPAVAVLEALALRARRVRALFVCGLQEGVFPARARPQPLLGEDERARLAELSGLRLGARADGSLPDQLGAERYLLYAAVSRPQERLYLSWHAADDDGQPSARSLFVDDVCDLFGAGLQADRARRALGAVDPASPPAGVPSSSSAPAPAGAAACQPVRRLLDRSVLEELRERVWSASSLERWLACPVSWFVERLLRAEPIDADPEPLARGALAHAALKETFEGLRRETGSARLTPGKLARARELLQRELEAGEREHPLSTAPERRAAVRRRLRADLERYLEHASGLAGTLEPSAFELAFGFAPEGRCDACESPAGAGERSELPALELGDGLRLRGRIDRVDVEDGEAVVYDYKGARAPGAARWRRDGDLQVALYMRAVQELLGVRAVGGFYQPLTGEDLRARGLLDADAAAAARLEAVPTDVLQHDEARELVAQALDSARRAAREAARGELQPRPQTCVFRGGCMYPSICRSGHGGR
ncbi:MAG TPA: PD-(D/E)XK nuclease family protein [Solirubrobacteraceae bacterium]|nr:PD-(D/E)XK nuclease family protein [Solirubrobacteraceae bacterium]